MGGARIGFALLMCAASACSHASTNDTTPETIEPTKDAVAKTTENGPVKVTIRVWPKAPTLGDPIYARLEIEAPPGVSIDAPFQEAGDQKLGRFRIVGFTRGNHAGSGGNLVQEQTYTLEAPSSGRHRIPPLRLEMVDSRNGKQAPQEVLSEEVPIEIAPVKTEAIDAQLRPAVGELDPDVGGTSWLTILVIVSAIAVAGSGSILAYRAFRARRRIARQRSAYDDAVAKLQQLEERGAPGSAAADGWFVELSAIVRDYLESRYDIRAPELTTEEFLTVAVARAELTTEHRALLVAFLERCDRVKFAGYRPDADESIATLKSARGFVEDTRLREERIAA